MSWREVSIDVERREETEEATDATEAGRGGTDGVVKSCRERLAAGFGVMDPGVEVAGEKRGFCGDGPRVVAEEVDCRPLATGVTRLFFEGAGPDTTRERGGCTIAGDNLVLVGGAKEGGGGGASFSALERGTNIPD